MIVTRYKHTSAVMQRRKRERIAFVRQRLRKFLFISRIHIKIPMDWRKYTDLPHLQSIIVEARQILIYNDSTEDYWIWITLWHTFQKHWKPLK